MVSADVVASCSSCSPRCGSGTRRARNRIPLAGHAGHEAADARPATEPGTQGNAESDLGIWIFVSDQIHPMSVSYCFIWAIVTCHVV